MKKQDIRPHVGFASCGGVIFRAVMRRFQRLSIVLVLRPRKGWKGEEDHLSPSLRARSLRTSTIIPPHALVGGCIAALALACVCLFCSCRDRQNTNAGAADETLRVTLTQAVRGEICDVLSLTGEAAPLSSVLLTSKVPGRLDRLAVMRADGRMEPLREGMKVARGGQVACVDTNVYAAKLRQAEAAAAAARAQQADATREDKRLAALAEEGAATGQMREKAATTLAASAAALQQAEAVLDLAGIEFDEATPESPIDGTVVAKHVDEGNILAPGMPIVTIQDLSKMKIVFSVPQQYLPRIAAGKSRVSISDGASNPPAQAVVSLVHPAVDPGTRTVRLEALVDNADGRFAPGMFVKVDLDIDRKADAIILPSAAVLLTATESAVFVVEGDRAVRRPIRIGIACREMCEVIEGIKEGEPVVVRGQQLLSDGQRITVANAGENE